VAFYAISLMYFVDFTSHLTTSSVLLATGRHLILYFHCKINSCANSISIFNLTVVAKMEEMAAVPKMEEGQA